MNIKEAIQYGIENLELDEKLIKIRLILSDCLNKSKEYLIMHDDEILPKETEEEFKSKIDLLKNNIPVQYITKKQEFYRRNI